MLRETFAKELRHLQDEILRMGSEVEENLLKAVEALTRRDLNASERLVQADKWFNQRRIDIGHEAFGIIATQQPIAGDLRLIAATLEIAGELERIHDYVKGIGNISLMIGETAVPIELAQHLPQMAEKARTMLHRSLDAYTERNANLAYETILSDDAVDKLYNKTYRAVVGYMADNPESFELAQRLEWAGHNLERAADRVTNMCEWIIYLATGEYKQGKELLRSFQK
ncbi:MAG: phosphate signaling complex protein PhoU [Ardenticatenaceae bacterium]|nr:phosphate signaling complex protein PhoU [Anaerolineales bacterium]MCB8941061.1 phosphate signaling complex protein PhoU [Ardenticatenaceae bacterium]MCB8972402.1 phosphate signaling complex protein PhoU [Ardenticatenaceae bacterium]